LNYLSKIVFEKGVKGMKSMAEIEAEPQGLNLRDFRDAIPKGLCP
jgi:hypothetical protein